MNKCNENNCISKEKYYKCLERVLKEKENNIFFDVESFLTIDEKVDFFNGGDDKYDNPVLAIIGFYYKKTFMIIQYKILKIESEKNIAPFFRKTMENL